MSGGERGEPPGGQALIRRVFDSLFGQAVPPPASAQSLADRLLVMGAVLASQARTGKIEGGLSARPDEDVDEAARRWAWVCWLVETGRISEFPPERERVERLWVSGR